MNKPLKVWVCIWDGRSPTVHRNRQTVLDIMFSDGVGEEDLDVNKDNFIYFDDYLRAELVDLED